MRELIVTMTHGEKLVVKADRVVRVDHQYLGLVLEHTPTVSDPDASAATVALFDRSRVAMVVCREHLVSEEKCEPLDPSHVVHHDPDSEIPF
jgi:hypothetical protein